MTTVLGTVIPVCAKFEADELRQYLLELITMESGTKFLEPLRPLFFMFFKGSAIQLCHHFLITVVTYQPPVTPHSTNQSVHSSQTSFLPKVERDRNSLHYPT